MSDDFGGIPVEDDKPDEFGGVPLGGSNESLERGHVGDSNRDGDGAGLPVRPREVVPEGTPPSRSLGDVAGEALQNLGPSALNTAGAIYDAVRHPIDTGKALLDTGRGAGQELAHLVKGDSDTHEKTDQEHAFDSLKDYFHGRYGSTEGFKNAVATDPVGVMMDLSTVLTGAGGAAARAPGTLGKVGEIAQTAGRLTNPVGLAGKGISKVAPALGNGVADLVGNLATHTGAEPIKLAAKAGLQGGDWAQAFLDNMRGNVPMEDVVSSAKNAVSQMKQERGAAYRNGMADVSKDKTVLDFDPIDQAIAKSDKIKNFKGVDISPETADVRSKIGDILKEWKGYDPAEFHTPEGFDALKQRLGDVRDGLQYGSPQRVVADRAYNAVKDAITQQAPEYTKVMKGYQSASDLINQIQKTLSLNPNASVDTSLRKLQSIMRNNVNTNYGARAKLLDALAVHKPELPYELAGQSLNKLTPRGLGAAEAGAAGLASVMSGHPAALPLLAVTSPRLVGETAYGLGAGARMAKPVTNLAAKTVPAGSAAAYEADRPRQLMDPGIAAATDDLLKISNGLPTYADGGDVGSGSEGTSLTPDQVFDRNKSWIRSGAANFNTKLSDSQEKAFRSWVADNHVSFDPDQETPDYDMRGFYSALQKGDPRAVSAINPNDQKTHYPDYWKTPYDVTFSNESQWANKFAPRWTDNDQLVTHDGTVVWDDKLGGTPAPVIPTPRPDNFRRGGTVHEEIGEEVHPDPSDAQIEAGNYKKGHTKILGFDLSIETPKGAARRGTGKDGKEWENTHPSSHYGYLKRTEGADEEHVDAYLGPHHDSKRIFVVNQYDPETKKFDEHKLIFGARGPTEARQIYDHGFSDGSGPKRRWNVHEVSPKTLRVWLSAGKRSRPFPKAGSI